MTETSIAAWQKDNETESMRSARREVAPGASSANTSQQLGGVSMTDIQQPVSGPPPDYMMPETPPISIETGGDISADTQLNRTDAAVDIWGPLRRKSRKQPTTQNTHRKPEKQRRARSWSILGEARSAESRRAALLLRWVVPNIMRMALHGDKRRDPKHMNMDQKDRFAQGLWKKYVRRSTYELTE